MPVRKSQPELLPKLDTRFNAVRISAGSQLSNPFKSCKISSENIFSPACFNKDPLISLVFNAAAFVISFKKPFHGFSSGQDATYPQRKSSDEGVSPGPHQAICSAVSTADPMFPSWTAWRKAWILGAKNAENTSSFLPSISPWIPLSS